MHARSSLYVLAGHADREARRHAWPASRQTLVLHRGRDRPSNPRSAPVQVAWRQSNHAHLPVTVCTLNTQQRVCEVTRFPSLTSLPSGALRRRRRPGQPGRAGGAAGAHGQHAARRARPGAQPAARAADDAAALRERAADVRGRGVRRGRPDRGSRRRGGRGRARTRTGACPGWGFGRDPAVAPPPPGGRRRGGWPHGVARAGRPRRSGVRRAGAHSELPGGAGGGRGQEGRAGVQAAARARRAAAARAGARAAARRRQAPAREPEQARPSSRACCRRRGIVAMRQPTHGKHRRKGTSSRAATPSRNTLLQALLAQVAGGITCISGWRSTR